MFIYFAVGLWLETEDSRTRCTLWCGVISKTAWRMRGCQESAAPLSICNWPFCVRIWSLCSVMADSYCSRLGDWKLAALKRIDPANWWPNSPINALWMFCLYVRWECRQETESITVDQWSEKWHSKHNCICKYNNLPTTLICVTVHHIYK